MWIPAKAGMTIQLPTHIESADIQRKRAQLPGRRAQLPVENSPLTLKNALLKGVTALALLLFTTMIALACGAFVVSASASKKCLDRENTSYRIFDESLDKPVAEMQDAALLKVFRVMINDVSIAASPECAPFLEEFEDWEASPDGEEWYEDNGEAIAITLFAHANQHNGGIIGECGQWLDARIDRAALGNALGDSSIESVQKIGENMYEIEQVKRGAFSNVVLASHLRPLNLKYECRYSGEVHTKDRVANVELLYADWRLCTSETCFRL